jgi:hypothetical protein
MFRHRRATLSGLLGLAVLAFSGSTFAAAPTRIVVTPTNLQSWSVTHAPPPPTTFNGPADSDGGNGSLRTGPIAAPASMKLELEPPEKNMLVSDFDSLSLEYQILTPAVSATPNHIYVNVYVDSAANGIGTFTNGFYDCRHGYLATANAVGWNSLSFSDATLSSPTFGGACQTSLGGHLAGSEIVFFRVNVGDTSANDNNLEVALDLVEITFNGNGKLYDFEPYMVASSKEQCKDGGWQGVFRANGSAFKNQGDCIQYVNTGK